MKLMTSTLFAVLAATAVALAEEPTAIDIQGTAQPAPVAAAQKAGPRLAGLIEVLPLKVTRNTGIAEVTVPQEGVYCIVPTAKSGVDGRKDVAAVTTVYGNFGADVMAELNTVKSRSCPKEAFMVMTFQRINGNLDSVDRVAFTILVP